MTLVVGGGVSLDGSFRASAAFLVRPLRGGVAGVDVRGSMSPSSITKSETVSSSSV